MCAHRMLISVVFAGDMFPDVCMAASKLVVSTCADASIHGKEFFWTREKQAVIHNGMFKRWEQWAEALNMVPGSDLYQRLYDDLPFYFQTTIRRNRKARLAQVAQHAFETQREAMPKSKSS